MTDNPCKTRQCVACSVENCVYHTLENTCAAGKISVGNSEARQSRDTCCDTFRTENEPQQFE